MYFVICSSKGWITWKWDLHGFVPSWNIGLFEIANICINPSKMVPWIKLISWMSWSQEHTQTLPFPTLSISFGEIKDIKVLAGVGFAQAKPLSEAVPKYYASLFGKAHWCDIYLFNLSFKTGGTGQNSKRNPLSLPQCSQQLCSERDKAGTKCCDSQEDNWQKSEKMLLSPQSFSCPTYPWRMNEQEAILGSNTEIALGQCRSLVPAH